MAEGKWVKINHVRTMKVKNPKSSPTSPCGWLSAHGHSIVIPIMLGARVIGHQQKAGEVPEIRVSMELIH